MTDAKKILIVSDYPAPAVHGVRNTLEHTIRILRERGHHVTLVEPSTYRAFSFHLVKLMREHDAIHIAAEGWLSLIARGAAGNLNLPFTTSYHRNFPVYMKKYFVPEWVSYKFLKWLHKGSAAVMAPTQTMMDVMREIGFKKVVLWGRGVDRTVFNHHPVKDIYVGPRPYFLNVGRIVPEKNLKAFLSIKLPGTKIVIGEGKAKNELQKKFPEAIFLGELTGQELSDWYNRADVFVAPSKADTFGLVIAEAISTGLPVAAYPVSGPKDIIENGVTGYVDNILGMAVLQAQYLDHDKVVRDFSWEAATDQFFNNLHFIILRQGDRSL